MSEAGGLVYLSDRVLDGLGISTADVVAAVERAVLARTEERLWTAPKTAVMPGDGRYMMATLAAADEPGVIVVKSVMVAPDNAARGLPGINGAILILDSVTGVLKAVMDANWVTAVRTAALSAVVARRLADPEAQSVAFVGCGVQAHSHLAAFAELFPLREIRAVGRGRAKVDTLCDAARGLGLEAHALDAREALDGVDLVVSSITLDYSVAPFLDARWLKPGAFATITDLAIPWEPAGMPAFDTVIIDDRVQEAESARPMVEPGLIAGDLTEMIGGRIAAGFAPDRRAAFVFRGLAVGDFALAALAYESAVASGAGTRVAG
ncbi:ornithine cyclodeaminase family protein [Defluviimonas salinarum]|uniref:Ornithine cyclodeaminase family protein n=1 Tax=Defluviimonas salinarum TaxID=2992147 RepID=A0ABT3J829_9RHOB|nr:ornithine cyclodeaminase family protein [Defluviimonas salinarum]